MHCHEKLSPLYLISFAEFSFFCEVLIKISMPVYVSIRPSLFSVFISELTVKQLNEFSLNMVLGNVSKIR
jgi:hypothetical protein